MSEGTWWGAVAISTCLLLLTLANLRRQRADAFRFRVRCIRDDLFDFMWKTGRNFTSREYREVRQTLNGILTLSDRVGPVMFFVLVVRIANSGVPPIRPLPDSSDAELKKKLDDSLAAAHRAWIRHLFCEGGIGLCLRALQFFFRATRTAAAAKDWVRNKSCALTAAAFEFGGHGQPRRSFPAGPHNACL